MLLKTDFHLHAREDKKDAVSYSAKELIDYLAARGYNALSLTFHDQYYIDKDLKKYATSKGITLIPGTERTIEGAHILILNAKPEEVTSIHTFEDLRKLKREDVLIAPSHPFFIANAIGNRLESNIDKFDAIEYCHFYLSFLNLNKKSVALAKKHRKPLLGNSDSHHLFQVGHTYSIVNAEKNDAKSIIKAIKQGNVQVISKPLSLFTFFRILLNIFVLMPIKVWKRGGHY